MHLLESFLQLMLALFGSRWGAKICLNGSDGLKMDGQVLVGREEEGQEAVTVDEVVEDGRQADFLGKSRLHKDLQDGDGGVEELEGGEALRTGEVFEGGKGFGGNIDQPISGRAAIAKHLAVQFELPGFGGVLQRGEAAE